MQEQVRGWLDRHPGEVTIVSACAGDGRDLLEVLASRADAARARVTLIETDARLAGAARAFAREAGLARVTVVRRDAGTTDSYAGAVPAGLVLMCGVSGNITDQDVRATIAALPRLCASGATVLWTRTRRPPDLTAAIRDWFAAEGFVEEAFVAPSGTEFSVGAHRLAAAPLPLSPGRRLFTFIR